jgi:hypothetical protein
MEHTRVVIHVTLFSSDNQKNVRIHNNLKLINLNCQVLSIIRSKFIYKLII